MTGVVRVDTEVQTVIDRFEDRMILNPLNSCDFQVARWTILNMDVVLLNVLRKFWIIEKAQSMPDSTRMSVFQCIPN